MKKLILFLIFHSAFCVCSISNAQSIQWLSRLGGISSDINPGNDEMVENIETDAQGNVYVSGRIRQLANFSGTPVTTFGGRDVFIAKYNCNGNLIWVRTAGGFFDDGDYSAMKLDGLGNIYLSANIVSSPTWPVTLFDTMITEFRRDIFLAKFDTSGNMQWFKIAGTDSTECLSKCYQMNIDTNGMIRILVAVSQIDTVVFFPGINSIRGLHFAQFDTSGNIIDLNLFSTGNWVGGIEDYKISSQNEQLIAGYFSSDSMVLDNQTVYNTNGSQRFFAAKFSSLNVVEWIYLFTDTLTLSDSQGFGIAITNDTIYAMGSSMAGLKSGNYTFTNLPGYSVNGLPFIIKLNSQGQSLSAVQGFLKNYTLSEGGVTLKSNGNAVISGTFKDTIVFGNTVLGKPVNTNKAIYIAEIDNNTWQWVDAVAINGTGNNSASYCITTDSADNVFIGGAFDGTLSANGNSISYAGGHSDGFIAKYGAICAVGLEDQATLTLMDERLLLYPNPVHHLLTVHYDLTPPSDGELLIHNTFGAIVLQQTLLTQNKIASVDVNNLTSGIYYLSIMSSGQRVSSGKFIKL